MNTYKIALAGNPNTGKSTLFNALTGLKQHTGNCAGKTVEIAEGAFQYQDETYHVIDLPGTYSLYSNSIDEKVARDFILFENPDLTIVVLDATALERNLNLHLQILEMTNKVIACINLIDEANKKGITINEKELSKQLCIPIVKISAKNKEGFDELFQIIQKFVHGNISTKLYTIHYPSELELKIAKIEPFIKKMVGDRYPSRWLAIRLLDGNEEIIRSLKNHLLKEQKGEQPYHETNATFTI